MLEKALQRAKKAVASAAIVAAITGCVGGDYGPTIDECVGVQELHYDAYGRDNQNLNGEYVIFKNLCNINVPIHEWSVADEDNNKYTFPERTMKPGNRICLRSGSGQDTAHNLHWNSKGRPIWNNDRDTLYLHNELGGLVLEVSYDNTTR